MSSDNSLSLLSAEQRKDIRGANCFDFLRYLFAISLIIAHFCTLTQIEQFWFISGGMRVKAFFIITGFLVTYSFLSRDCNIKIYVFKRITRIIPAYVVVIGFALIIGSLFTTMNIGDYWTNSQTWYYGLVNLFMLNWLQPSLPHLFDNNYMTAVNGSLWSMKFEVIFYCMVPILIKSLSFINKHIFSIIISIGVIAINAVPDVPGQLMYFTYFFAGLVWLIEFPFFRRHIWTLMLAGLALALSAHYSDIVWLHYITKIIEPFIFTSILLGVAYTFTFLRYIRNLPNVTYGLYLYHFPIIQILISLGLAQYNIWLCFVTTLVLTFAMANLSWFLIEKPLMNKFK